MSSHLKTDLFYEQDDFAEFDSEIERTVRDAVKRKLLPGVFEALIRVVKDGDADA